MSWILDFLDALYLVGGITGRQLSTGPLTDKEIILLKREISTLILRAENAYNNGFFSDARKEYIKALALEHINPKRSTDSVDKLKKKIERIENLINKDLINQFILIMEKADFLKKKGKFQDSFELYQNAFSIVKKMLISDSLLRANRINEIFIKQIYCLVEEGKVFKSSERGDQVFKKALEISESMINSAEKTEIIKELNKILDRYSDKIQEIIKSGISLLNMNNFDEAYQLFQEAKIIIKDKYSKLPNSIANRFKETNDLREVETLIDHSKNRLSIDEKSISLLTKSPDQKILDLEEKKKVIPNASDQPLRYTCKYCGIDLKEKPRFCPKCGIIWSESSF
jgi:tetratricopeptide (TPR) repeat protein